MDSEKKPWFTNRGQALQWGTTFTFGVISTSIGLFGGAIVLATLVGMAQKIMGIPVDWWILSLVFTGGLLLMWWSQRLADKKRLSPIVQASLLPLKPDEIIYPPSSKNGVLWEWNPMTMKLSGPFCPTHKVRLLYWPNHHGVRRMDFKEDDFLASNASFVCPRDDEEFIFIRFGIMRVSDLVVQATAQFKVEHEHRGKQSTE